jgi:tetratricopeptide (TPR) repeat protein
MKLNNAIAAAFLIACAVASLAGCGSAETRKARYLEHGEHYLEIHAYQRAGLEFRNALQIDPYFLRARIGLGRAADKLGNERAALAQFHAVIEADPANVEARVLAGRIYVLGAQPQKALDLVDSALEKDPTNGDLLTVRGAAREQLGDSAGALADAQQAYKRAPDAEYTVALLAALLQRSGRIDESVTLVEGTLGRHPDSTDLRQVLASLMAQRGDFAGAEAQLKELVRREPDVLEHRYALADFYVGRKNIDAAEQTLRQAVVAAPKDDQAKLALVAFLGAQRDEATAVAELDGFIHRDPHDYPLRLALARHFEDVGKLDQAQHAYLEIVNDARRDPAELTASDRLAALRLRAGATAEAARLVETVLKENPGDSDALRLRARMALDRGDPEAAIVDLRAIVKDQPDSLPAHQALASAYIQNKEPALAEEALRAGLVASPKDVDTRVELARLLEQAGKTDEAHTMLVQVVSDAAANSDAGEALLRLQIAQKDYAGARSTADTLIHAQPHQAIGNYLLGSVDEADGKPEAAVRDYEAALAAQTDALEPLLSLVRVETSRGRSAHALEVVDGVIAKSPADFVATNVKGQVLENLGRSQDAVRAYEDVIARAPTWWVPYENAARAQLSLHHTDAAIEVLERGVSKSGDNAALAGRLSAIYELVGEPDKAIALYDGILSHDPKSTTAANNLAMLLVSYRTDQASLERARALTVSLEQTHNPAFQDTLGWIKYKSGQYQQALPLLQAACQQDPQSVLKRYHLGMAQLSTGDRADARKNIELAVASKKHFLGQQDARTALNGLRNDG